jgi:hypothetical protein
MKRDIFHKVKNVLLLSSMIKIVIYYFVSFFSYLLLKPKNLKLKTLLAFVIYNLTFNIALGQTYPVQISTQLIPPYSGYLPDYADPTAQNLKVILQFNDFTVPSYNLKLKFEIKGNGFSLVTKSIYNPPPISLQPGQPLLLSGIDIAPYLSSNNLDFIGINQSQYEQRMALPEGYYSICVKAYDYYSGSPVQVSNEACAQGWFTLSNPPLLNLPLCNTVVTPLQPQNLLFSWTPVNLGSPNSALNTSYLFELWEMRPDSTVNPNQLVQNTQPIFSQSTTFNSLNYGIADPPLNLYYKYAWRVRVIDGSGRDWFINNGFSQVCTFYYGSISNTLGNNNGLNIQAEALDYTTGKATWTLQTIYNAYQFEVRKTNTQNWFPYTTTSGSQQIDNLEPNNTYEGRVKGFGNDFNSEYSNIVQFTTPYAPTYNCNQTAPIYSLNTTPLPINKALPGITLRSGQFDIKIKTIEPVPNGLGWYKGSGYALMFGLLPVPVTFTNVFIDDKLRHQQGLIEAVTQGIKNWMVQFDIEDAEDNATYTEGTLDSVYINGNQYCYTTIQNQTPVCTTLDTTNKITVIRDGDGNQYVVNAGPPPTVTGPTNYLNTSNDNLAASDTLKVEFIASPNQNFGFDGKEYAAFIEGYECIKLSNGKNYFVPNKSVGINQNDKVYASCTINNLVAANLSFKTFGGAILSKTSVNPTVFEITNIPANANCIYAWYNNKKIGKLNVTSLNKVNKKVVLVPVNSASLSLGGSQMGAALNAIYKQANTTFTITTASNFTFNLGNDGLEAADANLMSKYSAEMRALRNAYKQKDSLYDRNAYYFFIVSNFSDGNIKGYMARGRALGFLSANATATDVAHELAHGAFKLEHTFPALTKATSNNLMDYNNGSHLVKSQWLNIQNPTNELTWFDEEEDGSYSSYQIASIGEPGYFNHDIQPTDYAEYKNWISAGQDLGANQIKTNLYTITPTINSNNKVIYYTAFYKWLVSDAWFSANNIPHNGNTAYRNDWTIQPSEIGKFIQNLDNWGKAAGFLHNFGADFKLRPDVIQYLNGNYFEALKIQWKAALKDPIFWLSLAHTSLVLVEPNSAPFARTNYIKEVNANNTVRTVWNTPYKLNNSRIRLLTGTNKSKIAIIGRKMEGHVKTLRADLQSQGVICEIFDKTIIANETFVIDGQVKTWAQIEADFASGNYIRDPITNYIIDSEIPKTQMYKANQIWAQKLISEGYYIFDAGYMNNIYSKSLFYEMELKTIFKDGQ